MFTSNKMRFLSALLLGVAAIAAIWLMRRHTPSLLDHARRISNVPNVSQSPNSYFWLNDNEFLYLTPMQKAGAFQVMRRNIAANDETVQGDLLSGGVLVSPNGQWALTYKDARAGSVFTVERTDGSRKVLYRSPGQSAPSIAWLPDNSSFVELLPPFAEKGKTHPGLLRAYSLDSAVPITSTSVDEESTNLSLLGALSNHHILAVDNSHATDNFGTAKFDGKVKMLDFPIERDSVAHHYTISAPLARGQDTPPDAPEAEAVISPQGDRIAWLYNFVNVPAGYGKFMRLYDILHIHESYIAAIWICKPDGSDLHELGKIPVSVSKGGSEGGRVPMWPANLRWTTNGNNLSFLHENSLYIVPAQ